MTRILAVAKVAYQEAVRRRIFLSLWMFLVVIIVSAFSLPVIQQEARFGLVQFVAMTSTILFTSLIAIFISSLGLPEDIRDKRIMTLLSKPLRRHELLLGRILGLTAVMAGLLAAMLCILLFSLWAATGWKELPRAREVILPATEAFLLPQDSLDFGQETGRYWLSTDDGTTALTYRFAGLTPNRFGDSLDMELYYITKQQNHWNVDMGEQWLHFEIDGKRAETVRARLIDKRGSIRAEIPADCIRDDGTLEITVKRAPGTEMIGVRGTVHATVLQGMKLYGRSTPLMLNLGKAFAFILMENMFLITLCVSGSTFLSGPVAVVLGLSLLLSGSMLDYVKEALVFETSRIETRLAETRDQDHHDHDHEHGHGHDHGSGASNRHDHGGLDSLDRMLSNKYMQTVIRRATYVFPNFNRYNPLPWLKPSYDIPLVELWRGAGYMVLYAGIFFAVGYIVLRSVQIK